jgi:hypothetical protein
MRVFLAVVVLALIIAAANVFYEIVSPLHHLENAPGDAHYRVFKPYR